MSRSKNCESSLRTELKSKRIQFNRVQEQLAKVQRQLDELKASNPVARDMYVELHNQFLVSVANHSQLQQAFDKAQGEHIKVKSEY